MHRGLGSVAVVAILLAALPWSARAGDGTSVEDRLTAIERRLATVEAQLASGADAMQVLRDLLPNLAAARLSANEAAAVATLRNLVSAQAQCAAAVLVDADGDGTGEYAGLVELTGTGAGRRSAPLVPPVLTPALGALNERGEAVRTGYLYRVYLCGPGGAAVGESRAGYSKAVALDADLGEVVWCCYAWPVEHGTSGNRCFFVNQEGDVLATDVPAYGGSGAGPRGDAAFRARNRIDGPSAAGARGTDGNAWEPLR